MPTMKARLASHEPSHGGAYGEAPDGEGPSEAHAEVQHEKMRTPKKVARTAQEKTARAGVLAQVRRNRREQGLN